MTRWVLGDKDLAPQPKDEVARHVPPPSEWEESELQEFVADALSGMATSSGRLLQGVFARMDVPDLVDLGNAIKDTLVDEDEPSLS